MRIVLDTNVVVSGVLTEFGPPAQIVDLCAAGDLTLIVDARIEAEYRDVLSRPRLALDALDVADFLSLLEFAERVVAAPLPFALPDADDEPFLEVAVAGAADALVTGYAAHFRIARNKVDVPILSPRKFVDMFAGR